MHPINKAIIPIKSPFEKEKGCEIRELCQALDLLDDHAAWSSSTLLKKKLSVEKRKYLTLCKMRLIELLELTETAL